MNLNYDEATITVTNDSTGAGFALGSAKKLVQLHDWIEANAEKPFDAVLFIAFPQNEPGEYDVFFSGDMDRVAPEALAIILDWHAKQKAAKS